MFGGMINSVGLFTYRGFLVLMRCNKETLEVRKLNIATTFKLALADQIPFVYSNLAENVLNESSDRYLTDKVIVRLSKNDKFQLFISNKSSWKSTKVLITSGLESYKIWTQDVDKCYQLLNPYFADKISRG
jgi:hypothetical protein